jgi:hypothetical protein
MITNYKLGKIFGPSMVFAGYILMVFGVLTIYFTLTSIGLALLGAFLAFTTSGTEINAEKKEYNIYIKLFGFIPVGKEKSFYKDDQIEVKKFNGSHFTYSRSNRQSAVEINEYRIYLILANTKKKKLLAQFDTEEEALEESKNLIALIPLS